MAHIKENDDQPWCLDCEDNADEHCKVQRHEIVWPDQIEAPTKPDLTGTPAPQHTVNYF